MIKAISKPIFSLFPEGLYDGNSSRNYPERIHDPNQDLHNPTYRDDWEPGDTCWFYNRRDNRAYYAVVKSVEEPTMTSGKKLFVCLIGDDDVGTTMLDAKEAFSSLTDLTLTFFAACKRIKL